MLHKAYSTISPHSPQKKYITPSIFFQSDPAHCKNCEADNTRAKQPDWRQPMGRGDIKLLRGWNTRMNWTKPALLPDPLEYKDELD